MINFEEIARQSAKLRRESIALIPDNCKINTQYLGSMTNDEFVAAFREMQQLIINIYADVERAPFDWGYPKKNNTEELYGVAYNRISDFFKNMISNGTYSDGRLLVKKHKLSEEILNKLMRFGFRFDGYTKKADSFTFSYPQNPLVLETMWKYAEAQDPTTYIWAQHATFASFSYRWVECPDEQKHEPIFLVKTDMSPIGLQEIQYWLYDKAKEYGYTINMKKPFDKNAINYTKGSKQFILVGIKNGDVFTKVIFRKVFETHPEKLAVLATKCPGVFGESGANCDINCGGRNEDHTFARTKENQCSMRICYTIDGNDYENCAYKSFWFFNPTLDSFKDIFELFVIENKIK